MSVVPVASWYNCMPASYQDAFLTLALLDVNDEYRWNVLVYAATIEGIFGVGSSPERRTFEYMFGLTFVPQLPPENSYMQGDATTWAQLYDILDGGHVPDLDCCHVLRFPGNQGGAWPSRWPDSPPCPSL